MAICEWIAVDWGTTNLRAWAMRGAQAIDVSSSDKGMAALAPEDFEAALMDVIGPWVDHRMDVVCCGMVGARQGWIEAPYRAVPCAATAPGTELTRAPTRLGAVDVWIAPGLSQSRPADVMRGEETQIAGYLSQNPDFDGIICLPGTHTKWVHISANEVVSFRTFMTGEIFALLSRQTVLRHSTGDGWDDDAFATAVSDAMSRPERVAADLFGLRAGGLLHGLAKATATARLSGLLIGAELAAARPYWLGQPVALVGAQTLSGHYATALTAQGAAPTIIDAADLTLSGLSALYHGMKG